MSRKKRKRRFIVEHGNGYLLIYPEGKKPPTKPQLKPIDHFAGATLENGDLVNSREGVKKRGKNEKK